MEHSHQTIDNSHKNLYNYIEVALDLPLSSTYTYAVESDTPLENVIFRRVDVDFNGRKLRGYAVACGEFCEDYEIKLIKKIVDKRPVFNQSMVDLAKWISDYYFSSIGECLAAMIPKGTRQLKTPTVAESDNSDRTLNEEQSAVYRSMLDDIDAGVRRMYLYGVTGAGKTEIYIKLIEKTLAEGKSVIFMVPEIILSYQTLARLQQKFGSAVAIIHSNLTASARFNEYLRILDGNARIVVGPRSAILAPVTNLGLIIIDEEHESSYKSDQNPRLHARTIAQYLAKLNDAVILLGSATPSVESYFFANRGLFKLYRLTKRYADAQLPDIEIIDMTCQNTFSNLSIPMVQEINKRLLDHQQIVLLQNRRGYSNVIKCADCDNTLQCPNCNIYLTFHKAENKLICHHCGHTIQVPTECPNCHGNKLIKLGAGTQRIEDEISRTFPHARVVRMDFDTLHSADDIAEVFARIESGDVDIIIGTQVIAKGLHFPNIKFVGIINADIMLNIPDFKSAERAYSLITQVAGRAGRVGDRGFVMIQTVNAKHYSITSSLSSDYNEFFRHEIQFRQMLGMSPFCRMLRIIVRGPSEKDVAIDINAIYDLLITTNEKSCEILGPSPCQIEKINKNFRYQILLKDKSQATLQQLVRNILPEIKIRAKNYLEIDVDPSDLF